MRRTPLLWLALPFAGGLAAGRAAEAWAGPALAMAALTAALAALGSSVRHPRRWAIAVVAAMILAGAASYAWNRRRPAGWEDRPAREALLVLRVEQAGAARPGLRPSASGVATVVGAEPHLAGLAGQRMFFSAGLAGRPPPVRSAVIRVLGVLAPLPRKPPPDSFAASLDAEGLNFSLTRGRVLGEVRPAHAYRRFCDRLGTRMNKLLGLGLERRPVVAAIYRAMVLGRKGGLGPEQRRLFLESGTMHLFAINGLHVGIVALALHAALALARVPRGLAGPIVLAVLWLDVDTTGDSPSAVRAFLMIAALEAARILRLPCHPPAALSAAALAVFLASPFDLFGASFEMSYGVMAGILFLGLPAGERLARRLAPADEQGPFLRRLRRGLARHLAGGLGVGGAAALVGAVSSVRFFQVLAPSGLIASLAAGPAAAFALVAGFASLATGLAGLACASRLCNAAAGVAILAVQRTTGLAARLPGAWVTAHFRADWIGPWALAAVLAACLAGYAGGWSRRRGGFWPPFAVVAIVLLFGVRYGP